MDIYNFSGIYNANEQNNVVNFFSYKFKKDLDQTIMNLREIVDKLSTNINSEQDKILLLNFAKTIYDLEHLRFINNKDEDYFQRRYSKERIGVELLHKIFETRKDDIKYIRNACDIACVVFDIYKEEVLEHEHKCPDKDYSNYTICQIYMTLEEQIFQNVSKPKNDRIRI